MASRQSNRLIENDRWSLDRSVAMSDGRRQRHQKFNKNQISIFN